MRRYNKEVIAVCVKDGMEAFLLQDGDYINLHIINDNFKSDELNTLEEQIPLENMKDIYKTEMYLHSKILAFKLWHLYGNQTSEETLSFNVNCYSSNNDENLF